MPLPRVLWGIWSPATTTRSTSSGTPSPRRWPCELAFPLLCNLLSNVHCCHTHNNPPPCCVLPLLPLYPIFPPLWTLFPPQSPICDHGVWYVDPWSYSKYGEITERGRWVVHRLLRYGLVFFEPLALAKSNCNLSHWFFVFSISCSFCYGGCNFPVYIHSAFNYYSETFPSPIFTFRSPWLLLVDSSLFFSLSVLAVTALWIISASLLVAPAPPSWLCECVFFSYFSAFTCFPPPLLVGLKAVAVSAILVHNLTSVLYSFSWSEYLPLFSFWRCNWSCNFLSRPLFLYTLPHQMFPYYYYYCCFLQWFTSLIPGL